MIRSSRLHPSHLLLAALLLGGLAGFLSPRSAQAQEGVQVPSSELDQTYLRWYKTLADLRAAPKAEKSAPGSAGGSDAAPPVSANAADGSGVSGGENYIEIGGKRVAIKSAGGSPTDASAEALLVADDAAAATEEVSAATESAVVPEVVAAQPREPELVTIKVAKLVDGKIVEVEVQVTPTPGPDAIPQAAGGAQVGQATGQPDSLRDQLAKAARSARPVHFTQKQLQTLLRDLMAAEKKPGFEKIMPKERAQILQAKLQRLSAMAQGGNLPQAPAQALLQALYPAPKPPAVQNAGTPPGKKWIADQAGMRYLVDQNTALGPGMRELTPQEVALPVPGAPSNAGVPPQNLAPQPPPQAPVQQERQVYYDPNTGEYIYEDGTLAPVPEGVVYEEVTTEDYSQQGGGQGR